MSVSFSAQDKGRKKKCYPAYSTEKIKVMSWAIWQTPAHAGKQMKSFGDMRQHHDQQTAATGQS